MEQAIKEVGLKTSKKVMELNPGQTAQNMKGNTKSVKKTEKENFIGATAVSMKVSSKTIIYTDTVLMSGVMEENTSVGGNLTKWMEKESSLGQTGENTKEVM